MQLGTREGGFIQFKVLNCGWVGVKVVVNEARALSEFAGVGVLFVVTKQQNVSKQPQRKHWYSSAM